MRLVSPGPLARMVLPAVLARPAVPLLAWATIVPASSSSAIAPVVALRASTKASVSNGPELLAIVGVVAVYVVEGTEWTAALHLWLCRENDSPLAVHVLGLGFLLF